MDLRQFELEQRESDRMERFALDDRDTTLKRLGTGKVTLADISEAFAKPDSEAAVERIEEDRED